MRKRRDESGFHAHIWMLLLIGWLMAPARAAEPFALGGEKHLFIDGQLIDTLNSATLAANPPLAKDMVLIADQPWERNGLPAYATVLHDPDTGQDRMYYSALNLDQGGWHFCLATSADGIHWIKPDLGLVEWGGSRHNNIVRAGWGGGSILIDPNAPPQRRYAYYSSDSASGVRYFTSPDGLTFTERKIVAQLVSDSQISSFWDSDLRQYLHFPRKYLGGLAPRAVGRVAVAAADGDWGVTIYGNNRQDTDMPTVLARDARDPEGMDLYTNAAEKYAQAKAVYLAFPTPYYHYDHPRRAHLAEGNHNDGLIETQLATSRDSIHWTRYRTPYVGNYTHDGLKLKVSMVVPGLLYRPETVYQYFAGYTFRHGEREKRRELEGRALGGIFRLEQRPDGFAAVEFPIEGGEVITKPFSFSGNQLRLNLNTHTAGEGRVAVLDARGQPIEPFTLENCQIVHGDHLAHTVVWVGGGADLSSLAGQSVRLKLAFRRTQVFGFQFVQDALPAAPAPPPAPPTEFAGTGALWQFDEPADSPTDAKLRDASGNGFDLTLGANGRLVPGMIGNALEIKDRTGGATWAAYRPEIAATALNLHDADCTFECFVRITAPRSGYHKLFQVREGPLGRGDSTFADLHVGEASMRFNNEPGGGWFMLRTAIDFWDTPTLDWHHVAITYTADEDQHRLFLDGRLQLPLPPPFPMRPLADTNDDYLSIGCDGDGDAPFNGLIDEVRISNACLYTADFTPPARLSDPSEKNAKGLSGGETQ